MVADERMPESTPVLIVGGGPVGLLQALLLSRHGGKLPSSTPILSLDRSTGSMALLSTIFDR